MENILTNTQQIEQYNEVMKKKRKTYFGKGTQEHSKTLWLQYY